ncbi:uncharacterized protein LOC133190831 [Saccostrea echinata]|uniref:uncharacterized protein LOC133190831 n=1 Tax=Saccostrea echinata TaxID=191078 RepID=UPI002A83A1A9|nr:uncharacterized protein LOC133190831 [Saccostrea echinata]
MEFILHVLVTLTVISGGISSFLDENKLEELNWYMTKKISDIIIEEVGIISENMTADQRECENKISLVSDTCFECSRLIVQQEERNAELLQQVLENVQPQKTKPKNGDWIKIRDKIVRGLKKALKKTKEFFERKLVPRIELPDIPKIKLPKIHEISKIKLPAIEIPSVHIPDIKIPDINIKTPKIEIPKIPQVKLPKVEIPPITLPAINIQEINLKTPQIEIPKITIPEITLPKVEIPNIEIPNIRLPTVDLSKFRIPKITIPKIDFGSFQIPKFTLPSIKLPKIAFPKIDLGRIFRGKRSITDCKECEQFRKDSEENIVRKVCGAQYMKETETRQWTLDKLRQLYSGLEKNFLYNVTYDEHSLDSTNLAVKLISIEYKLPNTTDINTYNATGDVLYLNNMPRSVEILASQLYQDFVN